jgi:hypothetical protein
MDTTTFHQVYSIFKTFNTYYDLFREIEEKIRFEQLHQISDSGFIDFLQLNYTKEESNEYLIFREKRINTDEWERQLRESIKSLGLGMVLNLTVPDNRQSAKMMLEKKAKQLSSSS